MLKSRRRAPPGWLRQRAGGITQRPAPSETSVGSTFVTAIRLSTVNVCGRRRASSGVPLTSRIVTTVSVPFMVTEAGRASHFAAPRFTTAIPPSLFSPE